MLTINSSRYFLGVVFYFFSNWATAQVNCSVVDLQTEHLYNPLGIDASYPRLSWRLEDLRSGAKQTAWQLIVGTDSAAVSKGTGNYWTVIHRNSDTQLVSYAGKTLQPFTRYYWSVRVWDKDSKISSWSQPAAFETGMMDPKNWKGAWISDSRDIQQKAAPYFRNTFTIQKKVRTARVYMASAGLHQLYINGTVIGDHRLDPMYTRFDRRLLYVTWDVTNQLQSGNNAIGVLLGNGWYNHQSTAVWYFHEAPWRGRPAFCFDLRITYEDGTTETIRSGRDWKTSTGPLIFNSIYTAEHYDNRLEQPGWNATGFIDSSWKNVIYRSAPSTNIVSQSLQPIRAVEKIPAVSVRQFNDTDYVFDLGRNIAGVSQLTVKGTQGTIIRLRHAERIYPNGHTDQSNIDVHYRPTDNTDPFQTDIVVLKGGQEETFMPRFNYKGFQYVEVTSSQPIQLSKQNLTGYFMHSDVPVTGTMNSSNTLINKIWSATNNSYLSNLYGYPTDCPQREKNGWTGDAHIAVETGLYNFDGITVYEKWMADHRDEQQSDGVFPSIIPSSGWGYEWGNGPDWTSTIALIPWNLYLFYGDSKPLSDCYENIKRYVDHINDLYPSGLTTWGLGDWVPVKSKAPVEFTSTAYYFTDATILARAARLLGKQEDYKKYQSLAQKIKDAFNKKYLDTAKAIYGNGIQTELSVPLLWELVPANMKEKIAASLAKQVLADSIKLDVGLLGSKAILNALSENGYADIAYAMASRQTYPSWGDWVANGATTLYEDWNSNPTYAASLNHIMFGEIGAWFYKALGGIKPDPAKPGFKNILLHPYFVNGLDSFSCNHKGPYGVISSSWIKTGNTILYKVTVPPNSAATFTIDVKANQHLYRQGIKKMVTGNSYKENLPAGTWTFELKF